MSKVIKKIISTDKAAAPVSAYSQAVCVNNIVYVAGTVGFDKTTKKLVDGGVVAQARKCFENLAGILEAAGSSLANVVKITILLHDIDDFQAVNDVYKEFFKEPYPARISFQAGKFPMLMKQAVAYRGVNTAKVTAITPGKRGLRVEIDAIAVTGDVQTIVIK